jgi:hypothetical protein
MQTWAGPDPSRASLRLDPLLPVQLAETAGNWAKVICSNGWSAWVDGRLLITLPRHPAGTAEPLDTTEDPRPLLAALENAIATYRQLVGEYADGTIDLEDFRTRTKGLRLGAVLDGQDAWLLDLDRSRWYYCDGTRLQSYAAVESGDAP